MATRIVVPDAAQTTDEMLLVKWYVAEGDAVEIGDILADVETDKALVEIEAYVAGHVLGLLAEEGETVAVGQGLLWLGELGEAIPEDANDDNVSAAPEAATPETAPVAAPPTGTVATPAARTVARERGLDLAAVTGTGPGGAVVKRDVIGGGDMRDAALQPLSPMRRAVASRLQQSFRDVPHFYVAMDVDMTGALAVRKALAVREASAAHVTVNDLIVKATADALAEFPALNCLMEGDALRRLEDVNIGLAVGLDDGVVVPVLPQANTLSLDEVAERTRSLVADARAGRMRAGARCALTLSNLGMYGVKWFTAIISPPEVAILAVGALADQLAVGAEGVVAVPTLTLTLSSDHRVIDGRLAARFLKAVKDKLEAFDHPRK